MGQLVDIPGLVKQHFEKISNYFNGLSGFFGDPEVAPKDASEAIQGVDLSGLRRAVESRVNGSASTTNAALLDSYRSLDSVVSEMGLRNMTRDDYYREAAVDAATRQAAWKGNMQNNLYNLTGARQAPKDS